MPAIAETLEFSFSGPILPKGQLFNYLRGTTKQAPLLILDNLEHLLPHSSAAVEFVTEILQRVRCLKILCTSRVRMNLHGEWTYELHGLPVPPWEYGQLNDYSAAALFIQ